MLSNIDVVWGERVLIGAENATVVWVGATHIMYVWFWVLTSVCVSCVWGVTLWIFLFFIIMFCTYKNTHRHTQTHWQGKKLCFFFQQSPMQCMSVCRLLTTVLLLLLYILTYCRRRCFVSYYIFSCGIGVSCTDDRNVVSCWFSSLVWCTKDWSKSTRNFLFLCICDPFFFLYKSMWDFSSWNVCTAWRMNGCHAVWKLVQRSSDWKYLGN